MVEKKLVIPTAEYAAMEFNPLGKKDIYMSYPRLESLMGMIDESFDDRHVRYILLVYDKKSPLTKYYPNLKRRKEFAADIAGFDIESAEINNLYDFITEETIIEDEKERQITVPNDKMITALSSYLSYQDSRLWAMIVTNEQAFYEYQEKVMSSVTNTDDRDALSAISIKTKLLEAMDDIHKRLDAYYSEFTGDDKALQSGLSKKRITAESIAHV